MRSTMRPWVKLLLVSLAIAVLGVGVYLVLSKQKVVVTEPAGGGSVLPGGGTISVPPLTTPVPGGPTATSVETVVGGGGVRSGTGTNGVRITPLSDHPAFDFWTNPATGDVLYIATDGRVFRAKEGADEPLSTQEFSNLISLEASPDRARSLVAMGNPRAPEWLVFDILDRAWRPLPQGFAAATWGQKPDRIIAQTSGTSGARQLVELDLSRPALPQTTLLARFELLDVSLALVASDTLLVTERPSAKTDGRVWSVNPAKKTFSLLLAGAPGLILHADRTSVAWFLSTSPRELRVLAPSAAIRELVSVPFATFAPKCAGRASTTYCFTPTRFTGLVNSLTLPDDWLSGAAIATDALYRTNLADGVSELMFTSGSGGLPAIDATHVEASGSTLDVLNRRDRTVYEITLPPTSTR